MGPFKHFWALLQYGKSLCDDTLPIIQSLSVNMAAIFQASETISPVLQFFKVVILILEKMYWNWKSSKLEAGLVV